MSDDLAPPPHTGQAAATAATAATGANRTPRESRAALRQEAVAVNAPAGELDHWLVRDPIRTAVIVILLVSLAVRFSVVKDSFFITDDYMLSARAMENPLSWGYLTRVHTGHFEPIGFTVMWLLAHLAPLNWAVTVLVLIAGQAIFGAMMWRLLVEVFGRRPALLIPYAMFCFTPLTLSAFTWLAAAIIWLPLMIAIAGMLIYHTRYVRSGRRLDALWAVLWFVVGLASFEKIVVFLTFIPFFTMAISPTVDFRLRSVLGLVRRTLWVWLGYAVALAAYLVLYIPGVRSAGNASPVAAPTAGPLGDFVYLSVLRTFVPGIFGGPWDWQPTSYGLGIVDSPRAFDWLGWLLALVLVGGSLVFRRGVARFWVALLAYIAGSLAVVAMGRVAFGGAIVALETRYLADAVVPLFVTLGACVAPMVGEEHPWLPLRARVDRAVSRPLLWGAVSAAALSTVLVSLHAFNGYAAMSTRNPYRGFVDNAVNSFRALPASAQVFDTAVPGELIGPLFAEYNSVSRFLAPVATDEQRDQMYTRRWYTNPYVITPTGELKPMTVSPSATAQVFGGCQAAVDGRIELPLSGPLFEWSWAVRVGYLADSATPAVISLGSAQQEVPLVEGLGEVWVNLIGAGDRLVITGLADSVNVCVGDAQVGLPQAAP